MALLRRPVEPKQYASGDYQKVLKQHGMICSKSRRRNCWDNAPMESWFHTLEVELIQDEVFGSRRQAMAAVFEYMEVFYNGQRSPSGIGGLTPLEIEQLVLRREA